MSSKEMAACVLVFVMALTVMTDSGMAQNSPKDYVNAHNKARFDVGVGNVTWDPTVQAYEQNYSSNRKADCALILSNGSYGELMAWSNVVDYSGVDAVRAWVAYKKYYNYSTNTCTSGKQCGIYTQVVWRNSTKIGCARVVCDQNAGTLIMCNYSPAGNIPGKKPY